MLDAKIGFNGDVNLNFRKNASQVDDNKEELYEQLYKPLLLVNTCWLRHAEEVNLLLEKKENCVALSKEPFYKMYSEITKYNANFVKCFSLGKISSKYKPLSNELVQCALYLEKHFGDEIIDKNFIKNAIRIHERCGRILDMLRYDFGFQV